jgi:hypothetical protein
MVQKKISPLVFEDGESFSLTSGSQMFPLGDLFCVFATVSSFGIVNEVVYVWGKGIGRKVAHVYGVKWEKRKLA